MYSTKMLCRCKVVKKEYGTHTCTILDGPEKPIYIQTIWAAANTCKMHGL